MYSEFFKKIYVDTSGVKSVPMLQMALETFSAKQILWGSDFPAKRDLKESIGTIEKLDIKLEEKQGILGKNLEQIFRQLV